MTSFNKKGLLLLVVGDIACFLFALLTTFFVRYGGLDTGIAPIVHISTWGVLFVTSLVSFFIAGLYEKHTLIFEHRLPELLFKAQLGNVFIAVACFYFLPLFGASPRTLLFLYLAFSSLFISLWRLYGRKFFLPAYRNKAVLIGSGEEFLELVSEVNGNPRYPFMLDPVVDLSLSGGSEIVALLSKALNDSSVNLVVVDFEHDTLRPIASQIRAVVGTEILLVDMCEMYEEVFDRVPISITNRNQLLQAVSPSPHFLYDALRRLVDITVSLVLGTLSLLLYPLVYALIAFDDRGPMFFFQERVGTKNRLIRVIKFRSMNRGGTYVTRAGSFLRVTRIDELPQLFNVLRGDLSLIGPRPELPSLAEEYEKQIPYYALRHTVKPGLSGWAQIYHKNHPHHRTDVLETKVKLSYDLYYLKHRSLLLDLKIALRTIQTLLSRSGV